MADANKDSSKASNKDANKEAVKLHCNFCEIDGDTSEFHSHDTKDHTCRTCQRTNKRYKLNLATTGHSASIHTNCVRCNKRGHFVDNCPLVQDIKKKKSQVCKICITDGDPRQTHGHTDKEHVCKDCKRVNRNYVGHSVYDHYTCVICTQTGHKSTSCPSIH